MYVNGENEVTHVFLLFFDTVSFLEQFIRNNAENFRFKYLAADYLHVTTFIRIFLFGINAKQ